MRRILVASLLFLGACGSGSPGEWTTETPTFNLAGETADPVPVDRVLPDGLYWATAHEVLGSDDIVFRVMKARFGAACESWARENGMDHGCPDDHMVDDNGAQMVVAREPGRVTVAKPDGPGTSYRIKYSTLVKFVRNEQVDHPAGYQWVDFPFILTVRGGKVRDIDQYWTP